jgi:terminal nucleotidyltransferase 5A/B
MIFDWEKSDQDIMMNMMKHKRRGNAINKHLSITYCEFIDMFLLQVERLRSVLDQEVQIHGRENFPTLEIPLHTLILNVRRKLREHGLPLKHVKLNGGAASFVFAQSDSFAYSDVDLIFPLDLTEDQDFERVREAVFDALLEMMPSSANKAAITAECLRDVYIRKMVKVTDGDRWSLFSLHNDYGRCVEK